MKLPVWRGLYVDLSAIPIGHPMMHPLNFGPCQFGPLRFIIGPRGYPWIF